MNQIQIPPLAEGETYIGAIGNSAGEIHHLVLLAGDNARASWEKQMEWAKSIGGDLPTRREQSLLIANLKEEFEPRAYWSCEPNGDGWAWYQHFSYGGQTSTRTSYALRARAVRRWKRS